MSWLRLDANFFQSPAGLAMGFHGRLTLLAALCTCKAGGNRGTIKKRFFTPTYIAQFVGDPDPVTASNRYSEALSTLLELGILEDDGSDYVITGWKQRQIDPKNAERQARHRERKRTSKRVTSRNGSNGDSVRTTDVVRTRADATSAGASGRPAPVSELPLTCWSDADIERVPSGAKFRIYDQRTGWGPVTVKP